MQFLIELTKKIQSLDESEFKNIYTSTSYFARAYPELSKKWQSHVDKSLIDGKKNGERYWKTTIREMRYWKEQELDHMYKRVMGLSRHLLGKNHYFKIQTYSGKMTVPDRTTILNRLVDMSDKLLSELYPLILCQIHYRVDNIEISTQYAGGNIDWNKTMLNAVKTSAGVPISFIRGIPKKSFSTPENLLLHVAVSWVFNDAVRLSSLQKINEEDKKKIWAVFNCSQSILESLLLTEIKRESHIANLFTEPTPKIKPILVSIERNLKYSGNSYEPYLQLITWMRQYIDINVNRYDNLINFTFENTRDFDKMFELWVLFEMTHYLKQHHGAKAKPLIKREHLNGFRLEIDNHVFTLYYEKHYDAQIGKDGSANRNDYVKPDYTVEANEQCRCGNTVKVSFDDDETPSCRCNNFEPKVILVMDAKNWRYTSRMDAVKKMAWYLIQMNKRGPKTAILFFSSYEGNEDKTKPQTGYWYPVIVNNANWKFINYVVVSSKKLTYTQQLDSVFKEVSSKIYTPSHGDMY